MKRNPLVWILGAVAMLGVAALTYWFGYVLLPPRATAQTVGTLVPWYLTWGLIWMTVVISIILAVNLCMVALESPTSDPAPDHTHVGSTPDARLR
jgi:uncharacterized membrane protein